MNVTEMKESDLDIVVELEKQCFKQPWNKEQCLYELQGNPFSNIYSHLTICAPKGSTAEQFVEEWQGRYYKFEKYGWPHTDKSVEWIAFEPEEEGSQS